MRLGILIIGFLLLAQAARAAERSTPYNYSFGILAGPFVPDDNIPGISDVIQVGGLRVGGNTYFGNFEVEGWLGNGGGAHYQSLEFNYRLKVGPDYFPAHAILGVHADNWNDPMAVSYTTGGWQFGGGFEERLSPGTGGGIAARVDFEYRFGPAQNVLAVVSLVFGFGSSTSN